ncbi:hypothetical protein Efla_005871 [Eimeria flavescens]
MEYLNQVFRAALSQYVEGRKTVFLSSSSPSFSSPSSYSSYSSSSSSPSPPSPSLSPSPSSFLLVFFFFSSSFVFFLCLLPSSLLLFLPSPFFFSPPLSFLSSLLLSSFALPLLSSVFFVLSSSNWDTVAADNAALAKLFLSLREVVRDDMVSFGYDKGLELHDLRLNSKAINQLFQGSQTEARLECGRIGQMNLLYTPLPGIVTIQVKDLDIRVRPNFTGFAMRKLVETIQELGNLETGDGATQMQPAPPLVQPNNNNSCFPSMSPSYGGSPWGPEVHNTQARLVHPCLIPRAPPIVRRAKHVSSLRGPPLLHFQKPVRSFSCEGLQQCLQGLSNAPEACMGRLSDEFSLLSNSLASSCGVTQSRVYEGCKEIRNALSSCVESVTAMTPSAYDELEKIKLPSLRVRPPDVWKVQPSQAGTQRVTTSGIQPFSLPRLSVSPVEGECPLQLPSARVAPGGLGQQPVGPSPEAAASLSVGAPPGAPWGTPSRGSPLPAYPERAAGFGTYPSAAAAVSSHASLLQPPGYSANPFLTSLPQQQVYNGFPQNVTSGAPLGGPPLAGGPAALSLNLAAAAAPSYQSGCEQRALTERLLPTSFNGLQQQPQQQRQQQQRQQLLLPPSPTAVARSYLLSPSASQQPRGQGHLSFAAPGKGPSPSVIEPTCRVASLPTTTR